MDVYIPLAFLMVLLCFWGRHKEQNANVAFWITMVATCLFAMFRYEFGPDYFNYREIYEGVQGADLENYVGRGKSIEKDFLWFLQQFPKYTYFVFFLTLFWFATNALFLKKFVPYHFFWVVILYFFSKPDYFLDSLVAMRTAICASIFLVAIYFLLKRKRIIFVALIVLASLIHTSAIALIPLALINTKHNSIFFQDALVWVWGAIALVSLLIGHNFLIESLSSFVIDSVEDLQRYSEREVGMVGQSMNALIFRMMSFAIMFYLVRSGRMETDDKMVILYKIAIVAAMINLVMGQSIINDRYFLILNPVYILCIVSSFRKNPTHINALIVIFVLVIGLYIFYNKFSKPYFISFLEYKSIFSAPFIP